MHGNLLKIQIDYKLFMDAIRKIKLPFWEWLSIKKRKQIIRDCFAYVFMNELSILMEFVAAIVHAAFLFLLLLLKLLFKCFQ